MFRTKTLFIAVIVTGLLHYSPGLPSVSQASLTPAGTVPPNAYPTFSGGRYVAKLRITHQPQYGVSDENPTPPATPVRGWFRLNNNISMGPYRGGYLNVTGLSLNPPTCGLVPDDTVKYMVQIELPSVAGSHPFPRNIMDKIHIESRVILRPHGDRQRAVTPKIWPYPTTLDILFPAGPTEREIVFEPFSNFEWVDQDVELELSVWLDPSITDGTPWAGSANRYTFQLPAPPNFRSPLRTIKSKFAQVSPYMVPVAIIGDPPGNQSWSQLGVTQGMGAGLATFQGNSTSVTTQESWGFGPLSYTSPTYTTSRATERGIHQRTNVERTKTLQTNGPWGPGKGDLMVTLLRPTFALFRGAKDMDFRFLCGPGMPCWNVPTDCRSRAGGSGGGTGERPPHVEFFPMQDLLTPPLNTPVARLTAQERQALINLNPLLQSQYAELREPRYYFIDSVSGSAGQVSAEQQAIQIQSTQVTDVVSTSTTRDDSISLAVPLGAVASALGAPFPIPDLTARLQETTTTMTEYRTIKDVSSLGGTLLSYKIGDSDPNKRLCVEVYFDSLFNTFAFRDCNPPPINTQLNNLANQLKLRDQIQARWQATRVESAGKYAITGSLGTQAPPTGGMAHFVPLERGKPRYHVAFDPNTANMIVPNMVPGQYRATIQGATYTLSVSAQGQVTMTSSAPSGPALKLPAPLQKTPGPAITPLQPSTSTPMLGAPQTTSAAKPIVNEFSGKCVDVAGGAKTDGANVQQFGCHGGPNQQWDMKSLAGNAYQIMNMNSGKCLDVAGGLKTDGTNVQQFRCQGGANQQWVMTPLSGGHFQFVNKNSGKCLDVAGGSKNDGANIQQFSCHGGPSQRFRTQGPGPTSLSISPRSIDEPAETGPGGAEVPLNQPQ